MRMISAALFWILALPGVAAASGPGDLSCLSRQEMHGVVSSNTIVAPNSAVRAARAGVGGTPDLVRVQLCRRNGDLVYVVTFLRRDGMVAPVTVDATTGRAAR